MWIRSQNKSTLLNVNFVRIHDYGDRCLITGAMDKYEYELGLYSTKEKALKVLDDIQEFNECTYSEMFQMPQNDEVTI